MSTTRNNAWWQNFSYAGGVGGVFCGTLIPFVYEISTVPNFAGSIICSTLFLEAIRVFDLRPRIAWNHVMIRVSYPFKEITFRWVDVTNIHERDFDVLVETVNGVVAWERRVTFKRWGGSSFDGHNSDEVEFLWDAWKSVKNNPDCEKWVRIPPDSSRWIYLLLPLVAVFYPLGELIFKG